MRAVFVPDAIRELIGDTMSLRSLSARAVWRDTVAAPVPAAGEVPLGGSRPAVPTTEQTKAVGALIDAIPTEVLAPYTAILAIIIANTSSPETRAALRWWTYAASLGFIIVFVVVSYLRSSAKKRKLPWAELAAALVAFGAWGLAMPGSPLTISLHASDFAIASAMISIGGAALLGLLAVPINAKSTKAA